MMKLDVRSSSLEENVHLRVPRLHTLIDFWLKRDVKAGCKIRGGGLLKSTQNFFKNALYLILICHKF